VFGVASETLALQKQLQLDFRLRWLVSRARRSHYKNNFNSILDLRF